MKKFAVNAFKSAVDRLQFTRGVVTGYIQTAQAMDALRSGKEVALELKTGSKPFNKGVRVGGAMAMVNPPN